MFFRLLNTVYYDVAIALLVTFAAPVVVVVGAVVVDVLEEKEEAEEEEEAEVDAACGFLVTSKVNTVGPNFEVAPIVTTW